MPVWADSLASQGIMKISKKISLDSMVSLMVPPIYYEIIDTRHRFELRNAVISFHDVKSTPVSKFRVFFESPNAPNDKQVDG